MKVTAMTQRIGAMKESLGCSISHGPRLYFNFGRRCTVACIFAPPYPMDLSTLIKGTFAAFRAAEASRFDWLACSGAAVLQKADCTEAELTRKRGYFFFSQMLIKARDRIFQTSGSWNVILWSAILAGQQSSLY